MSRAGAITRISLLALFYLASAGHGGCGDDDDHAGLPAKNKIFTKARGTNTGGLAGEDTTGECTADEKGKAACYGDVLVHCSDDGEPHAVDCTDKDRVALTTHKCAETETTADCQ